MAVVTIDDRLAGPSRGSAAEVLAAADSVFFRTTNRMARPQEVTAYLLALQSWATRVGLDFSIMAAQSAHETNWWRSSVWANTLNPAGIGITDGPNLGRVYAGGADAAAAHVVHMHAYAIGPVLSTDPLAPYVRLDPRYSAVVSTGLAGHYKTLRELTGRWATDPVYADKIARVARAIWPDGPLPTPAAQVKETRMATLPAIPDWSKIPVPVLVQLIPPGQKNQRPGGAMVAETITHHETANTSVGANALMHSRWLDNGAPGGADSQVGVHFFVDDSRIVQKLPLNEHGWHAGDGANGPGNRRSIAVEICVNKDGNRQVANRNARIMTAYLLWLMNRPVTAVVQHNKWSGKNCPTFIRQNNEWPGHLADIGQRLEGWRTGGAVTPPPVVVDPPGGYPEGMTYEMARAWFGSVQALGSTWAYDPRGPVSQLWLAQGRYPSIVSVEQVGPARYYRFADGLVIWKKDDATPAAVLRKA